MEKWTDFPFLLWVRDAYPLVECHRNFDKLGKSFASTIAENPPLTGIIIEEVMRAKYHGVFAFERELCPANAGVECRDFALPLGHSFRCGVFATKSGV